MEINVMSQINNNAVGIHMDFNKKVTETES